MKKKKFIVLLPEVNLPDLFKVIGASAGIIFLIFFTPRLIQTWFLKKLDSQTFGVILSIKKQDGIKESQFGSKIVTKGYHIEYQYEVNEAIFKKYQYLQVSALTIPQSVKFRSLETGDTLQIKFESDQPENSMIYPD